MASPFSIFRKNQKVMLAVITILAMFAFVFIGPWGRGSNGPSGGGSGTPVATWKFGTIYRSEVDSRIGSRHVVNAFIASAAKKAAEKGAYPDGGRPGQFPEQSQEVLTAIVLHKKAEQLGLAVTDQAINDFINSVTQDKLDGAELDAALREVGSGRIRYTPEQIFDALRFELEVNNLSRLLRSDVFGDVTPEQWYDYFSRLNRHATIQVLPVEVKDFVAKVPDPTDSELKAFFEKYNENFTRPDSPEPGFKVPVKAKLQYFQAKIDDFVKVEKPKVADDEIKKYYDEHKELFRKSDDETGTDSSVKPKTPEKAATPDSAGKPDQKNDKADKKTDSTDKAGDKKPDAGAPGKTSEPGKEPAKSATDKDAAVPEKTAPAKAAPAAEKGPTDSPAPDKAPSTKPADGKTSDEKSTPSTGKSVDLSPSARHPAAEELLALADAAPPPPAKPADKPALESTKAADSKPVDNKGKDDKPPTEAKPPAAPPEAPAAKTTPEKAAPGKTTEPASTGEKAPEKTGPATTPASAEPAKTPSSAAGLPDLGLKPTDPIKKIPIVEYDSLESEKVRDKIRTNIARERADKVIGDALKTLRSSVSSYQTKLSAWIARQEGSQPQPPDFVALAKAKGVQFHETGWLSSQETYDTTEFGKSVIFSAAGQSSLVEAQAFYPQIPKFKPYDSYLTNPESEFVWWRVDYKDAYVPKFEDVKKEVLASWKFIQARKLAEAQAKEYADQVKKQQAELQEVFKFKAELHPSKDIGPFSWMSRLSVARNPEQPVPPRLTSLTEIDKAGDDFMRTVFTLDVGSTGIAMNQPKTIAYVIQLKSLDPPQEQFRRQFLQRMASRFDDSALIAQVEGQQSMYAKVVAIESEFDFKPLNADLDAANGPMGPSRNPQPSDEGDD